MSYTAKQLFPSWYSKVELGITAETTNLRIKAIEKLMKNDDEDFWMNLVNVYLDLTKEIDADKLEAFVNYFVEEDTLFPVINNQNSVRTLSAISLSFRLEKKTSALNYQLSLAISNVNFLEQYDVSQFPYLLEYARNNIQLISKAERSYVADNESFEELSSRIDLKIDDDLEEEASVLTNLEVQTLVESIKSTQIANRTLKEEGDVFWWIFGEYSLTTNNTFQKSGTFSMVLAAPLELFDVTNINYGLFAAKQYLTKALTVANSNKVLKPSSVFEVVNLGSKEAKDRFLSDWNDKISYFTPCLLAVKSASNFDPKDDWSSFYKNNSNGGIVNKAKSIVDVADQIYSELFFLNIL